MNFSLARTGLPWIFVFAACRLLAQGQGDRGQMPELEGLRPLLRQDRSVYRNYAFEAYPNYPDHSYPYVDRPRNFYGSMGDYLITGYSLYEWTETRLLGQEYGSSIYKDISSWIPAFDGMVIASDGYGDWGYGAIVGDGLVARFTPLTLSMVDFNGLRFDLSMPQWQLTLFGSRIERPRSYEEFIPKWSVEGHHLADDSTVLLGSRLQTQLGNLRLGLNGVNLHVYQSTRPGNSFKGRLRPHYPLINWVVVRFADDSPTDGRGGPLVQQVRLVVNGLPREDLRPLVFRHKAGITTQTGSISRATGEFTPQVYDRFSGYYQTQTRYYRGRDEIPLYADYFYRADHEAGTDVSSNTNLPGLLENISMEPAAAILRADGDEVLVYMFELSDEPLAESVEVETLVGNDYRVEMAILDREDPRARSHASRYKSTFYKTMERARGNVQDGSNLGWIRFAVGEHTALFTYSADLNFQLAGLEVQGEYARSALYSRFPAQLEGVPIYDRGKRSAEHGSAYFLNATRWFGRTRVGGEYFSMNPDFNTGMRTFVDFEVALVETNLAGLANSTVYWDLVEDNDDGDRYPDTRLGNLQALPNDRLDFDVDGVFPGQDDDQDGFPDTNRNGDSIPDYEEPFLMYDVEPIAYVYGLDRNNNDEPDMREDDADFDYPYDADQRGFHLFGQVDLSRRWSFALGNYSVDEVAGFGRNRSTYALLTYRRELFHALQRIFFENHFRRVRDDIADEFMVLDENPRHDRAFGFRGLRATDLASGEIGPPVYTSQFAADPLSYQDSYVNETYLEGRLRPWSTLEVEQKVRLRINWQQEGLTHLGIKQRGRRLDFWTWVSKVGYAWQWGRLTLTPQYKFLLLRLEDQKADRQADGTYRSRVLRYQTRSIPILRMEYPLMSRTKLQAGIQAVGPFSYRVKDRVRDSNSFEQRTAYVNLINRSQYFGYELYTIAGLSKDAREFDDPFQQLNEFDQWTFFIRGLIGFTEYGRPL